MDYGHTRHSANLVNDISIEKSITPGVGVVPEEINPDAGESLNLSTSWDTQRPPHDMGNFALKVHEKANSANKELGKIIELRMPPNEDSIEGVQSDNPTPEDARKNTDAVNSNRYHSYNDRSIIERKAVEIVEYTVDDFKRDKIAPEHLCDMVQEASDAYLLRKFNRELGKTA